MMSRKHPTTVQPNVEPLAKYEKEEHLRFRAEEESQPPPKILRNWTNEEICPRLVEDYAVHFQLKKSERNM